MEAVVQTQTVAEVGAPPAGHGAEPGLINVSPPMLALTWITFAVVALILYKVAWRPILTALDMRERGIRKALEDAEKARQEALASEERNRQLLQEAEQESRRIVTEARAAAEATARHLREDGERRARELMEEAKRDIAAASDQARDSLRRETANLTIQLASRVLARNVDSNQDRQLIADAIKEMPQS